MWFFGRRNRRAIPVEQNFVHMHVLCQEHGCTLAEYRLTLDVEHIPAFLLVLRQCFGAGNARTLAGMSLELLLPTCVCGDRNMKQRIEDMVTPAFDAYNELNGEINNFQRLNH